MARQGVDAVAVQLGNPLRQVQAQLDGFKSRALRLEGSTPRHLYLTEWHSLDAAAAPSGATLVLGRETWYAECERWPSKTPRHELAATIGDGDWAVLVATLAITRECFAALPLFALEVALAIGQAQAAIASPPAVFLLSRVIQASNQPAQAGPWGLARSARAEASLPVHCIDRTAAMVEQHCTLAEPEVVMRHDACLVPRLARARGAARNKYRDAAPPRAPPDPDAAPLLLSLLHR